MRPSYLEYLLFPCQLLGASGKPEPPCHQLIFDPRTNGTDVGAVRDDVLLDRGSENDVTEEIDFEGTSAGCGQHQHLSTRSKRKQTTVPEISGAAWFPGLLFGAPWAKKTRGD